MAQPPVRSHVAGFWRRLLGFFVDSLVLGVPAFLAGIVLFDQFAALGNWGRLVGFSVALLYFGILNSSIGGGQTVGKRCFRTRTVDQHDQPIGLGRSMFRYTILALPFFLNGAGFLQAGPPWLQTVAAAIIFGGGGAIIYLLIFNARNRRSLHDLLAGTRVIRTDIEAPAPVRPIWKGHFVIIGVAFVALFGLGAFLFSLIKPETFSQLLAVQQRVLKQPHVAAASVVEGTTFFTSFGGEQSTTTHIVVSARVTRRPEDYDRLANEIAAAVLEAYPAAETRMRLVVGIDYGYDIGIARASVTQTFNFTPAEWQQRLQARGAPQV